MKKLDPSRSNDTLAFNLTEAARAIGVSKPTMHKLLPQIQHRRVGRRVLIPKSALERWLEEAE